MISFNSLIDNRLKTAALKPSFPGETVGLYMIEEGTVKTSDKIQNIRVSRHCVISKGTQHSIVLTIPYFQLMLFFLFLLNKINTVCRTNDVTARIYWSRFPSTLRLDPRRCHTLSGKSIDVFTFPTNIGRHTETHTHTYTPPHIYIYDK